MSVGWLRDAWRQYAYQGSGPLKAAWPLLAPASTLYGLCASMRRNAFQRGLFKADDCGAPVISVGNLTVGGTGKTPLVIDLAKRLRRRGHRPGVLLRGYKRQSEEMLAVTCDSFDKSRVVDYGDEAALYLHSHALPAGIGSRRIESASLLLDRSDCDVLVLDDGFQHIQLKRNLDLLVFPQEPFGNGRCLPGGPLREPARAMRQADALIFNGEARAGIQPGWPVFSGRLEWRSIAPFRQWRESPQTPGESISEFHPREFHLISGLGDPDRLEKQAKEYGFLVRRHFAFADHHWFSFDDLKTAEPHDGGIATTTEKDAIRLLALSELPAWTLQQLYVIRAEWQWDDEARVDAWLDERLKTIGLG